MADVAFTAALLRHVPAPPARVPGATVREVLEAALQDRHQLRAYVLDEQGRLRKHVAVFVDGELVTDREGLSDPVRPETSVYVMQALSGG